MDSPRGRISLLGGLVDGTIPLTSTTVEHFDRCLGCMAFVTACPSGVQYDRLIEQTREHIEENFERGAADAALRRAVFELFPHPRRLRALLALPRPRLPGRLGALTEIAPPRRWVTSAAPPETTPAAGLRLARVGLLLGCV